MIVKLLTYASFIVAANAYYNHQVPVPIGHTPYYGNNAINGHHGYHGNYIGQNYGHVLPTHQAPVNPWIVPPSVHNNNVNANQYLQGYQGHSALPLNPHSTALAATDAVSHSHVNHIVPPSVNYVDQPTHHQIRPINYQQRAAIPAPIFLHHSNMQHNNPNWAW